MQVKFILNHSIHTCSFSDKTRQAKQHPTAFLRFSFCCLPVNFYSLEMPIFLMLFNVMCLFEKEQRKRTKDAEDLTHSFLLFPSPTQQVLFLLDLVRNKSRLIQLQNLNPCQVKYFSEAYPPPAHTIQVGLVKWFLLAAPFIMTLQSHPLCQSAAQQSVCVWVEVCVCFITELWLKKYVVLKTEETHYFRTPLIYNKPFLKFDIFHIYLRVRSFYTPLFFS